MPTMPSLPPDPERDLQQLLAEEPFVRELARQLIAGDADEVVQQTWLRAVQQGGGGVEQPRHWLARIVRNLARNLRRDDRRRRARLESLPPPDLVPSSAALAEREERRRALVAAVDALPTQLRTVVLLRWFEGHPPRRIAEALGVPATTVSTQLQRALVLLRQRLDAEHGGDRRAWLVPLVPFAVRPELPVEPSLLPVSAASATPMLVFGLMTMTKSKLVAGTALLLVAASAWLFWSNGEAATGLPRREAAPPLATLAQAARGDKATDALVAATTTDRTSATPPPAAATTGNLVVHVRHGDDHSPAIGRMMTLERSGADSRYDGLRQRTDNAGAVHYDGIAPGRCRVSDGHLPGKQVDVIAGQTAEVVLDLDVGITVTGIVVDAARSPVAGALVEVAPMAHSGAFPEVLAVTGADGRFTARACHDLCLVGARAFGHTASRVKYVHGKKGNTAEIELVLRPNGGALEGTVVDPAGTPVANAIVIVGAGELSGIAGQDNIPPFPALARSAADGTFRAIGVPEGTHPVRVRAPQFAPWASTCEITAGLATTRQVELAAGMVIRGIVLDAEGKPVDRARIQIGDWNDLAFYRATSAADGCFEFRDLPDGELLLKANHTEFGKTELRVATTAGTVPSIEMRLSRGLELSGRVVDTEGQPVANARLECMAETGGDRPWFRSAHTDALGRFLVANCPETTEITISANATGFQDLRRSRIDPRTPELQLELRRAEPATVRIVARVVTSDGKPMGNASVSASRQDVRASSGLLATDNDGRVELGPLVPGTWGVNVRSEGHPEFYSEPRELTANATWDLGTITMVVGGTARIPVVGAKIDGAFVIVTNVANNRSWAVTETAEGYHSSALAPGEYRLLVSGKGTAAQAVPFTIQAGEEVTVPVQMQPGVAQKFLCDVAGDAKAESVRMHVHRGTEFVGWVWVDLEADTPSAELSLLPGEYVVSGELGARRGRAAFTVGAASGPSVTATFR